MSTKATTTSEGCIPLNFPFLQQLLGMFGGPQAQAKMMTLDQDVTSDVSEHELSVVVLDRPEAAENASAIASIDPHLNENGEDSRMVVARHFQGAMDGSSVLDKVKDVIEKRGFTPDNTLYAQSVCPDEINHEKGDITNLFTKYMGEVFHLGGLAGLPFSGQTGFGAFSHHVPNNGHCFVLMAPHIGISATHHLGKYTRDGQGRSEGAACGAACGALAYCESGKRMPSVASDALDYQQNFIIRRVNAAKKRILKNAKTDDEKMRALIHEIWKLGKSMMLDKIVHADFGGPASKLLVLTGIQINMPRPQQDMFQPLSFTLMSKSEEQDLFVETFGRPAPVIR